MTLSHLERIQACLAGEKPDHPPIALWRHFPVDDQSAETLAVATMTFQQNYDFDIVKVSPASSFCIRDWGSQDVWQGHPEGIRQNTRRVIQTPKDWRQLKPLDPTKGMLAQQVKCLQLIKPQLYPNTPFIQTIFSPLSQAKSLVGAENLSSHLRLYPDELLYALKIITKSTINFIEAIKPCHISGVFFALQHATTQILSEDEFLTFCKPFDLEVCQHIADLPVNMLHIHGTDILFNQVLDYPHQIFNWHDRETSPDLSTGQQLSKKVICGGLQNEKTLMLGTPQAVMQEVKNAIKITDGKNLILGTGCVIMTTVPHGNIRAACQAVSEA